MAASQDHMDDRQHGHAIRRRQGGRTSIYHDVAYPSTFWNYMDPDYLEDLAEQGGGGVPSGGIPGSDGSTGAV